MQSSTYTVDSVVQANGRRWVNETHTDAYGRTHRSRYLAPAGWTATEMDARLANRAARIDAALAKIAQDRLFDDPDSPFTLEYTTAQEVVDYVRAQWRRRNRERLAQLAYGLWQRVQNGDLTETQIRNAFGMSTPQWNAFRDAKLIPLRDAWTAIQNAEGE